MDVGGMVLGTTPTLQLSPADVQPDDVIDCTFTVIDTSGESVSSLVSTTVTTPPFG